MLKSRLDQIAILCLALGLSACASNQELLVGAALRGDSDAIGELLAKADVNAAFAVTDSEEQKQCPGRGALTPLQAAACVGNLPVMEQLLRHKADVSARDGRGETALAIAMGRQQKDAIKLLIENGADPDTRDHRGFTALMTAAQRGDIATTHWLLSKKADVSLQNPAGATALALAASPTLAKALVAGGARFTVSPDGNSPLHFAAQQSNADMVEFFLQNGQAVDHKNNAGLTPFDLAKQRLSGQTATTVTSGGRGRRAVGSAALAAAAQTSAAQPADNGQAGYELLKKEMLRLLAIDVATAGHYADEGRSSEALAGYSDTINRAANVDPDLEQKLRIGIIRYAASQEALPVLSAASREHLVRSAYLLKNNKDQGLVEAELAAVIKESPWWAEGYYNLGVLQAERKKLSEATTNLNIFIAAVPTDPKAQAAQDKLYEIKLVKEEIGKVNGMTGSWISNKGGSYGVTINGSTVQVTSGVFVFNMKLNGDILTGSVSGPASAGSHGCTIPAQSRQVTGLFDANARIIELEYSWSNYESKYHCVNMAGQPSNCCLLCDKVCDGAVITSTPTYNIRLTPAGR